MHVFCSQDPSAVSTSSPAALPRVLPLPATLDSPVVVLLHLLLQEQPQRPVTLDASSLRCVCPVAALLLAATLGSRSEQGAPVQIIRVSYEVRRRLEQHLLQRYLAAAPASAALPTSAAAPT
jgi:hypothetical protein